MAKPMKYFGFVQTTLSILVMPCGFLVWGMAAIPGIWMFQEAGAHYDGWMQLVAQGAAVGIGLLAWCILDLVILGIFGLILRPRVESARWSQGCPAYSAQAMTLSCRPSAATAPPSAREQREVGSGTTRAGSCERCSRSITSRW